MRSDHSAPRTTCVAGPDARTVTVRTPDGPVALDVDSVREAVALVLTIAAHWSGLPGAAIGPHRRWPGATESSTGSPDRAGREHRSTDRDTDREHHRESGREHPLPSASRSRITRAIPRPAA